MKNTMSIQFLKNAENTDSKTAGAFLQSRRKELGKTQADVAMIIFEKHSGIVSISKIENGKIKQPHQSTREGIAKAYELTIEKVDELFNITKKIELPVGIVVAVGELKQQLERDGVDFTKYLELLFDGCAKNPFSMLNRAKELNKEPERTIPKP